MPNKSNPKSLSAGLLLCRRTAKEFEVFLAHPGGPFSQRRVGLVALRVVAAREEAVREARPVQEVVRADRVVPGRSACDHLLRTNRVRTAAPF